MKFEEKMRKVEFLPTRDCEAGYGPACWRTVRGTTGDLLLKEPGLILLDSSFKDFGTNKKKSLNSFFTIFIVVLSK